MQNIFKNILWAVDALGEDPQHGQALLILGALQRATEARIEPVFLLSPANSEVPAAPFSRSEEAYRALAEKEFRRISQNCDLSDLKPLKILTNPERSTARDVEILSEYAKFSGADLIVTSTHSRRGLSKFILGSFTESLLVRSPVPVLCVNPETRIREGIRKILFATDFNPNFAEPFKKAMDLAQLMDADLTIYSKWFETREIFMNPEVREFMRVENAARLQRAYAWEAESKSRGIRIRLEIDRQPGTVVYSLIKAAEPFDLVMLGSQADPLSAWILGSKVKNFARNAPCPICVLPVS